jgi:hypothetical protein
MYLRVPEGQVQVGKEFNVDLVMNGGDRIIAATTMYVHFDPLVLEFVSVKGSLTKGGTGPLAKNMKGPGVLVISDINAPQKPANPEDSYYNTEMTGAAEVYQLTFKAVGEPGDRTFIGGGSTSFHDPGDGRTRGATPIGDAPFPRTAASNQAEIELN